MTGKSDFLEDEILDHLLGNASYSAPATTYIALFTATPSDSGGGTEVTGGSYARVAFTNNATNWPAASGGAKANGVEILFPTPSANWGTVDSFGIFDAATTGNLLYWGTVSPSKTINDGDSAPSFAIGDLDVTED